MRSENWTAIDELHRAYSGDYSCNDTESTHNMTSEDFDRFFKKLTKMTNNFTSMPDLCDEDFVDFTANYSDVLEAMAEDIWN